MNFLGLRLGGWAFNFWRQFRFSIVLPQGGSFVTPPFGAMGHFWLQIQFSIVLPQGSSFVGSPFGAITHFWLQIKFSIMLPQGGSFVTPPLGAISPKSHHSSTQYCAGLDDRYPIMSYTHGNLWTRRSRWCTPVFVFFVFSSHISVFRKKCISPKSRHLSTQYCAELDDRYPIMSYTHRNLWSWKGLVGRDKKPAFSRIFWSTTLEF